MMLVLKALQCEQESCKIGTTSQRVTYANFTAPLLYSEIHKALWLEAAKHVVSIIQSECIISEKNSHSKI